MRWLRRVRERRTVIAHAKSGNGERAEAADALAVANRRLREAVRASEQVDRLARQVRRALGGSP